jgi:hypothetical protein
LYLWMKDVIRSGREMEWSSEQERGESVCCTPSLQENLT